MDLTLVSFHDTVLWQVVVALWHYKSAIGGFSFEISSRWRAPVPRGINRAAFGGGLHSESTPPHINLLFSKSFHHRWLSPGNGRHDGVRSRTGIANDRADGRKCRHWHCHSLGSFSTGNSNHSWRQALPGRRQDRGRRKRGRNICSQPSTT